MKSPASCRPSFRTSNKTTHHKGREARHEDRRFSCSGHWCESRTRQGARLGARRSGSGQGLRCRSGRAAGAERGLPHRAPDARHNEARPDRGGRQESQRRDAPHQQRWRVNLVQRSDDDPGGARRGLSHQRSRHTRRHQDVSAGARACSRRRDHRERPVARGARQRPVLRGLSVWVFM